MNQISIMFKSKDKIELKKGLKVDRKKKKQILIIVNCFLFTFLIATPEQSELSKSIAFDTVTWLPR